MRFMTHKETKTKTKPRNVKNCIPMLMIPSVLEWARKKAGFSLEHAAKRTGVPVNYLLAWECGDAKPMVQQAKKLAKLYCCARFFPDSLKENLCILEIYAASGDLEEDRRLGSLWKLCHIGSFEECREKMKNPVWERIRICYSKI